MGKMLRLFAYGDRHVPHNNKTYDRIVLNIIRDTKPDIIIDGGDAISADCLSSYDKSTDQLVGLQDELDADYAWRSTINSLVPKARKILLKDNHFYERLEKAKKGNHWMEDLRSLTAESLLNIEKLGWEYCESFCWDDRLLFVHGDEKFMSQYASTRCPVNKVRSMVKDQGISIVRFHSHTSGVEAHNQNGIVRFAIQLGALQDPAKADYLKHAKLANWTPSIGMFYLFPKKHMFTFTPIFIVDGVAVCEGRVYS